VDRPALTAKASEVEAFLAEAFQETPERRNPPEDTVSLLTWGETDLDLIAADRDSILNRIEKR